jgi:hypothetical protein
MNNLILSRAIVLVYTIFNILERLMESYSKLANQIVSLNSSAGKERSTDCGYSIIRFFLQLSVCVSSGFFNLPLHTLLM